MQNVLKNRTSASKPRRDAKASQNANSRTRRYMSNIGLFIQSQTEMDNGDSIVLNSFLRDGVPTWHEEVYQGQTTFRLNFSTANGDQYLYIDAPQVERLVAEHRLHVSDDGQFLQISATMQVAPTTLGSKAADLEMLGLSD